MLSASARAALVLGTVLQLLMVIAGHFVTVIAALFAPVGVLISLVASFLYGARSGPGAISERLLVGAVVGGACALVGIAVSWLLGDVDLIILLIGTASSAVAGGIGGAIGRAFAR